jgi:hypothetical protein
MAGISTSLFNFRAAQARLGHVRCCGPAGQQVEGLLGGRAGLGGVQRHAQAVVGVDRQRLVAELDLADERVMQALAAGPVEAHVVRGPADAERLAARRELPDQVLQVAVVRVVTGLRAQGGDELGGQAVPVGVEVGRRRIEEGEPGAVGRLLRALEHRAVERTAEGVGRHEIAMGVADDRRRLDLVEQAKDDRTDALLARSGAAGSDRARGAREVQEVRAFGLVELKGAGQRFEHELGGAADLAALQAPVVVGADAGQ